MTPTAILSECHRRGVTLRVDGDLIKYRPMDAMDDDLIDAMREHKPQLLREIRREAAADDAWEQLREIYVHAGQPYDWLTNQVRFAEETVSKLWVSSRKDPNDDQRFHAALQRWVQIATEAIESAAEGAET